MPAMDQTQPKSSQLQIKADDDVAKGRYANMAQVGSQPDAFVLDFALIHGKAGWLLSRVIISPGHAKRLHKVLGETIARYEERYGTIEPAPHLQ